MLDWLWGVSESPKSQGRIWDYRKEVQNTVHEEETRHRQHLMKRPEPVILSVVQGHLAKRKMELLCVRIPKTVDRGGRLMLTR